MTYTWTCCWTHFPRVSCMSGLGLYKAGVIQLYKDICYSCITLKTRFLIW